MVIVGVVLLLLGLLFHLGLLFIIGVVLLVVGLVVNVVPIKGRNHRVY